ncbi:MAG TPA: glycerol-3-phosphate dehydrogenase/oxidase [Terriglobales bacterium]|nr:glycerol-3-phosphate dehydrogenase/oxidase [Terriglobales bacterium]
MSDERFDVVVIGGGINGVAIARECACGGKRVLILEQNDFCSGVTSRSTRIIHGGLRYLEHGELGMVRESLRERERLRAERPHLVRPLKFLLAVGAGSNHSALAVRAGLWLYGALGAGRPAAVNGELDRLQRLLDSGRRWSVFHYDDARCEFPERLVAEWLREAIEHGAQARNHTQVLEIETRDGGATGVRTRNLLDDTELRASADWIINASGPWADRVCAASPIRTRAPLVGGVRGSHLVVRQFAGAPEAAVYTEGVDGRPIFVVPWNEQLLVGSTEVRDDDDPAASTPSAEETDYLLASLKRLFPEARLSPADVHAAFAGVRPLPYSPDDKPSAVTRRHFLHDHSDDGAQGMISVIGGKLTTAAALARECARKIGIKVEEPEMVVAPSALDVASALAGWSRAVAQRAQLPQASARALAEWHGAAAGEIAHAAGMDERLREPVCEHSAHIVAEAVAAVRQECAVTLSDILLRRVPVALGACWGDQCSRAAARRIGDVLGWSLSRIAREREAFEEERAGFLRRAQTTASR